ncbi:MAG: hypothetical protein QXE05_10140, partial [Nitrososphaeria archaeon]
AYTVHATLQQTEGDIFFNNIVEERRQNVSYTGLNAVWNHRDAAKVPGGHHIRQSTIHHRETEGGSACQGAGGKKCCRQTLRAEDTAGPAHDPAGNHARRWHTLHRIQQPI